MGARGPHRSELLHCSTRKLPLTIRHLDLMVHVQETIELALNWEIYNLNFSQNGLTSAYSLGSLLDGAFCGGFNLDTYADREKIILTWPNIDQAYRNELLRALRYQREVVSIFQGGFNLNSHAAKHDLIDLLDIDDDDKAEKHNSLSNISLQVSIFQGGFNIAAKHDSIDSLDIDDDDKAKKHNSLKNHAIFGQKGNISTRVARVSARTDLNVDEKVDLTTKVNAPGLTALGAAAQLASASATPGEVRAVRGRLGMLEARHSHLPANLLRENMNELWKLVLVEAPEISWIDPSSPSKKKWWLKVWGHGEARNPLSCKKWAEKLTTKGYEARIAHYVEATAPEARHEELRRLLPLLEKAMTAYRKAKNSKSNQHPDRRR